MSADPRLLALVGDCLQRLNDLVDRISSCEIGSPAWIAARAAAESDGLLDALAERMRFVGEAYDAAHAAGAAGGDAEAILRALIPEWRGELTIDDALALIDRGRRVSALGFLEPRHRDEREAQS